MFLCNKSIGDSSLKLVHLLSLYFNLLYLKNKHAEVDFFFIHCRISRSCFYLFSSSSLSHAWTKSTKALTVMWTVGPLNSDLLPPSSFLFSSWRRFCRSEGAHQISIADLLMPGVSAAPATISHWRWKGNEQAGRRGDREALTRRRSAVRAAPVHSELRMEGRRGSDLHDANIRTEESNWWAFESHSRGANLSTVRNSFTAELNLNGAEK